MIVLDRDIVAKLSRRDQAVVQHLKQYRSDEWTVPSIVAWETYKAKDSRTEMKQTQKMLRANFDRIIDFTDDAALEAAYLDERLSAQNVSLDAADLLNLATAHAEGGTFVTHNRDDFDKGPVRSLADVDVVYS